MFCIVIAYNNLGVHLLENNRRAEAMALFKGAAELMNILVVRHENNQLPVDPTQLAGDGRVKQATMIYNRHHEVTKSEEDRISTSFCGQDLTGATDLCSDDARALCQEQSFVYKRAIRLPYGTDLLQDNAALARACSIVLYNLGLVFHILACDSVTNEAYYKKARSLYEMSLAAISDGAAHDDSIVFSRLLMALLNNLAHANWEMARYEMANECLRRLHFVAMQVDSRCASQRNTLNNLYRGRESMRARCCGRGVMLLLEKRM